MSADPREGMTDALGQPMIRDDIEHRFTTHPPESSDVEAWLDDLTRLFISVGITLEALPKGREQALALTKLEECSMWAKAAVARNQEP